MKKIWSVLLVVCLCCGLMVGCGGKKFSKDKPYVIKTDEWECEITITGVTKTDLMYEFSEESAKKQDIVDLQCEIKTIKGNEDNSLYSFDVWNNIRVCDENGNEVKPFEYVIPGDDERVIPIGEGKRETCTIPYALDKGARYVEVDIYQDAKFSNRIKIEITE